MRKKRKWEWVTLLTRLNGSAAQVEAQWAHNSAQVEMSIKTYPLHWVSTWMFDNLSLSPFPASPCVRMQCVTVRWQGSHSFWWDSPFFAVTFGWHHHNQWTERRRWRRRRRVCPLHLPRSHWIGIHWVDWHLCLCFDPCDQLCHCPCW